MTFDTEAFVRERLEANGHELDANAPLELQIEIESIGSVVRSGAYLYCVKLRGRVLSERVVEKCEYVRFTNTGSDPVTRAVHVVLATAKAVSLERTPPDAHSVLYTSALAELTDVLGRQAVRRE